jgi:hypothetical protein
MRGSKAATHGAASRMRGSARATSGYNLRAMNARKLALLLGSTGLAWALLLLRPAAHTSAPGAEGAAPKAAAEQAAPRAAAPTEAKAVATTVPPARPKVAPADAAAPPPATADQAAAEERRKRLAVEGDRRHDRRFDAAVARFNLERRRTRQEPWASQTEHALRGALERDRLTRLTRKLECRATLCRIELAAADEGFAHALRSSVHFRRELGVDGASALTGEGSERMMILYVPRRGMQLTGPPAAAPKP